MDKTIVFLMTWKMARAQVSYCCVNGLSKDVKQRGEREC